MANYVSKKVLILHISGGAYSLKSPPNDRFFWETFQGNNIYSQSFCQKFAERKSPKKYFSYFLFWCLAWASNPGFSSNKPIHYLLEILNCFKECESFVIYVLNSYKSAYKGNTGRLSTVLLLQCLQVDLQTTEMSCLFRLKILRLFVLPLNFSALIVAVNIFYFSFICFIICLSLINKIFKY